MTFTPTFTPRRTPGCPPSANALRLSANRSGDHPLTEGTVTAQLADALVLAACALPFLAWCVALVSAFAALAPR